MSPFEGIGKLLLIFGVIMVALGLFFTLGGKIPFLGKLPGDIFIHKEKYQFYFPLVTCILISVGLTVIVNIILWILRK